MKKTYQGSCHCGKVRFEADIDLSSANSGSGRRRCNCWICARQRVSETLVKPEDFRLLAGAAELGDYQFGTGGGHHLFCRICGAATFGRGVVDATGAEYVSIAAACLDNANPALMPRLVASVPLGAARC